LKTEGKYGFLLKATQKNRGLSGLKKIEKF